jgi:hypothetical protein
MPWLVNRLLVNDPFLGAILVVGDEWATIHSEAYQSNRRVKTHEAQRLTTRLVAISLKVQQFDES